MKHVKYLVIFMLLCLLAGSSKAHKIKSPFGINGGIFDVPALAPNGTAALPAYSFDGDPNTGLFWISSDTFGISTGGTLRVTVDTANVTSTLPILAPDGAVSLPAYSFASDPDSGFYLSSAANLRLSLGGSIVGIWDVVNWSGTVSRTFLLRHVNSSAGAPTYSFLGDTNTGMYSVTADTLGFSTNAVERLKLDTETTITSIASDGTGKAVCIKADTTLGTCTDAVGAGGTCTCS